MGIIQVHRATVGALGWIVSNPAYSGRTARAACPVLEPSATGPEPPQAAQSRLFTQQPEGSIFTPLIHLIQTRPLAQTLHPGGGRLPIGVA
jgi:hypothetical protein